MATKVCCSCKQGRSLSDFKTRTGNRYSECYDCRNSQERRIYKKDHALKKQYGITYDDYLSLLDKAGFKCEICETPLQPLSDDRFKTAAVDHNHATGQVRGVLCIKCNVSLGTFLDRPEVLRKAADYLQQRGCYGEVRS